MRRLLCLVLTSLLGVSVLALPAAAAEDVTVESVTIPVVDGPNDNINITIEADVYIPPGVDADNPAPVIINAHGFGGSKTTNDNDMNTVLSRAGYVVFAYSSRGFGQSTGRIGLNSVDYDVKDVVQLIDWLAQRPEVELDGPGDPRLGMVGPSYGGGIQLQVAGVDDRVDVIVPFITWHSLVSSLSPNYLRTDLRLQEGRPTGVFKQEWTTLFYSLGNAQPIISPPGAVEGPCPGFVDPLCQLYTESLAAGRATDQTVEILKTASPATAPRRRNIDIPTLLIQGQADTLFTVNEAAANYQAIAGNGAPVKMIWHDGGHGYPYAEGELEFLQQRTLAWFDRHLRGRSVNTGPGFEYYRRWGGGSGAGRYDSAPSYPAARPARVYLSGNGTLVPRRKDATAGSIAFGSTPGTVSYSETSNFQNTEPFSEIPPFDPPGTFAEFVTGPLARPATVVGIPTIRFALESTIGEAQLFAKLYDVAPDGTETLVRRLVAPIRATEMGELEAQLAGIAHRFGKGHRIRLVLAATDKAYGNLRVPTLYTAAIEPGEATLDLPLVGARRIVVEEDGDGGTGSGDDTGNDGTGSVGGGDGLAEGGSGSAPTLPATGGGGPLLPGVLLLGGLAIASRRGARRPSHDCQKVPPQVSSP